MRRRAAVTLGILLAGGAGACADGPIPGPGGGPVGGTVLRGTLRDAETGEPVSRETVYLHFFHDSSGWKQSLERGAGSDYRVEVPEGAVRIRASDAERVYLLLEETVEVPAAGLLHDIPLRPSGYVLLRGRVLDARTGRPLGPPAGGGDARSVPGGGPLLNFYSAGKSVGAGYVAAGVDGAYSVRVPRAVVEIRAVNTPLRLVDDRVDLTSAEGSVHEFDIRFE